MDIKAYRHKWLKDHKDIIYGKWYTNRLIPEEEEKYYVELSKTYHYCKSLGIEETIFEISIPEIKEIYDAEYKKDENFDSVQAMSYNLATKFFGKDIVPLAESLPEFDEEFDFNSELYDIMGK